MNIELFVAVLAALVAYRILSPLIDAINPLVLFTKPKKMSVVAGSSMSAASTGLKK
ncbi:hypothetical protein SAMN05880566_13327 [Janthinobacterium sp. TND4EL3]|uniref:hypothetical protein n=1 Tax=Janthinobacterium sp. TND4EL3 TaxID=1907311 RepID=UPI000956D771|nr:hypothetical protein [Janthinobacterium sp. TND4EL3]SIR88244.1 hypothetical protein SAMN05880566_13327 [Janthinobacterium sp. TND4EL3]